MMCLNTFKKNFFFFKKKRETDITTACAARAVPNPACEADLEQGHFLIWSVSS